MWASEVVHLAREEVDGVVIGETNGEYHLGDARAGVPTRRSKWRWRKRRRLGEAGLGVLRTSTLHLGEEFLRGEDLSCEQSCSLMEAIF